MTIVQLLKLELRHVDTRVIPVDEVPEGFRGLLELAAAELEAIGFGSRTFAVSGQSYVVPGFEVPDYYLILEHTREHAHAIVRVNDDGAPYEPCSVVFMTRFEDDQRIATVNALAHRFFAPYPDTS